MRAAELLEDALGKKWRDPAKRATRLKRLDDRALARFYLDIQEVLAEMARTPPPAPEKGDIWAYVAPDPGKEHRWLTAVVFTDHVVLNQPDWEPISGFALKTHYELAAELAGIDVPFAPAKEAPTDPPWVLAGEEGDNNAFNELWEELEHDVDWQLKGERDAFRRDLPGHVANYVQFLVAASAPMEAGRLSLLDAWDSSWRLVIRQLRERQDDWGWTDFGTRLEELSMRIRSESTESRDPVREAVSLYEVRQRLAQKSLPLVPSSAGVAKLATLFLSHWRRLDFGFPMVAGPGGEPINNNQEPDWRPALFEKIALPALPHLTRADPGVFGAAATEPGVGEFRDGLKKQVAEILASESIEEAEKLMAEAGRALSRRAEEARKGLARSAQIRRTRERWETVWDVATTTATTTLGIVFGGVPGAIAGAGAGLTIRAARRARHVDPDAPPSPELSLLTLE